MKCQHPGCEKTEGLTACFYPDNESEEANAIYCTDHTFEHGFCYCCEQFWGGVESFEFATSFGGIKGLCENCTDELRAELDEDDEDDEDLYYAVAYD